MHVHRVGKNLRVDWLYLLLLYLSYSVTLHEAQDFIRLLHGGNGVFLKVTCNMHIEEIVTILY